MGSKTKVTGWILGGGENEDLKEALNKVVPSKIGKYVFISSNMAIYSAVTIFLWLVFLVLTVLGYRYYSILVLIIVSGMALGVVIDILIQLYNPKWRPIVSHGKVVNCHFIMAGIKEDLFHRIERGEDAFIVPNFDGLAIMTKSSLATLCKAVDLNKIDDEQIANAINVVLNDLTKMKKEQ